MTTAVDVEDLRALVEQRLESLWDISAENEVTPFYEALRYSLLAPGKRIRPVLTLASAESCGADPAHEGIVQFACAVELIHAYSLVHDDLPCMDDDDLRRGRATSHRVYGEGVAVLVGDALQSRAFAECARATGIDSAQCRAATDVLARAAEDMVVGQYLDIQDSGKCDLGHLRKVHGYKTGAMLSAATELGALAAGCDTEDSRHFGVFGAELGWLFQLVDDLLDEIGDESSIGKPAGSDRRHDKQTAVSLLGLEGLREEADAQLERCLELAASLPGAGGRLPDIARYVRHRDR